MFIYEVNYNLGTIDLIFTKFCGQEVHANTFFKFEYNYPGAGMT